jgi:hypothetical protein
MTSHSLPVVGLNRRSNGLELPLDDLVGHALLPLLEALSNTSNDAQTRRDGRLGLVRDELVRVSEEGSALRVAEDDPVDVGVLELVRGDLAGESARGLGEAVLRGDLDGLLERVLDAQEVDRGRSDDDVC